MQITWTILRPDDHPEQPAHARRDSRILLVIAAVLALAGPASVQARPGELDPTFGFRGKTRIELPGAAELTPFALAILPDGKMLVVGRLLYTPDATGLRSMILRLDASGALDTTFGQNGFVISSGNDTGAGLTDVRLLPGGDFLVVGFLLQGDAFRSLLQRYHSDGTLDATFGTGGTVVTSFLEDEDLFLSLTVQPDDKILAAGFTAFIDPFYLRESAAMTLARFDGDGSPDLTFSGDGSLVEEVGSWTSTASSVALQTDGKIVIGGLTRETTFGTDQMAVVRYLDDGTLDTGFGGTGIVRTSIGHDSGVSDVLIQTDGKIVAAGASYEHSVLGWDVTINHRLAAARYLDDGTLDPAFGSGGTLATNASSNESFGTGGLLDPDGKLVLFGEGLENATPPITDVVLARYDGAGALDPGFGSLGIVRTPDTSAHANAIARQSDGKLVVAGSFYNETDQIWRIVLARYLGTGPDCSTGGPWPDTDGDGVCDALDNCSGTANLDQSDADLDGSGDVCDPCTYSQAGTAIKAKVAVSKLDTPTGDDKVKIGGKITVPTSPPLDPVTNGLRFMLTDRLGGIIADRPIPGGAYDPVLKVGWKATVKPSSTSFKYANKTGTFDITAASFKSKAATPGLWTVKLVGKKGAYAVATTDLPVTATVVFDESALGTGQCGEWLFPGQLAADPSCVMKPNGAAVKCK